MGVAIAAGLLTAAAFTATGVAMQHASRIIGVPSAIAWLMLVSLGIAVFVLLLTQPPLPSGGQFAWLAVAGVSTVAGQLLVATAFARGGLAIVQSLVSTEGAVAAGLAIAAGEAVGALTGVSMVLIALGAVCAAYSSDQETKAAPSGAPEGVIALTATAAVFFGVGLYATGRVSDHVSLWVAAAPPALVAVAFLTIPLAVSGRLRANRRVLGSLIAAGILQLGSFVTFAIGARHSIAFTGLFAGQSGTMAAIAAFLWLSERLTRLQYAGIAMIGVGVGLISATM
jgi:drug/metabolite transporter (DMT)-like permease